MNFEIDKEKLRDRLLACLAAELVVTDEAKNLLGKQGLTKPTAPEPLFDFTAETIPYPFSAWLPDDYSEGEEVEPDQADRVVVVRSQIQKIKDFVITNLNNKIYLQQVEEIFPILLSLIQSLADAQLKLTKWQQEEGVEYLVAGCSTLARCKELSYATEPGQFAKQILLAFKEYPKPYPEAASDAQFEQNRDAGFPLPRIEAAKGLTLIAANSSGVNEPVLQAAKQLSQDPVPAVRHEVVRDIWQWHQTAPAEMWQILTHLAVVELNRGILVSLVEVFGKLLFDHLAQDQRESILDLVSQIYKRVSDAAIYPDQNISIAVRRVCLNIWLSFYLDEAHLASHNLLLAAINDPINFKPEILSIVFQLRHGWLNLGQAASLSQREDEVRNRAWSLLDKIVFSVKTRVSEVKLTQNQPTNSGSPSPDLEQLRKLLQLANDLSKELYFASGAFDPRNQVDRRLNLTEAQKKRFFEKAKNAIAVLGELGQPVIGHNLLETLEYLVEFEPEEIFLQIGKIVQVSQEAGYQFEPMACNLVVRLVNRYLAEFRYIFRKQSECLQVLKELLDIFVLAGWPSAIQLVYQLDEIFR